MPAGGGMPRKEYGKTTPVGDSGAQRVGLTYKLKVDVWLPPLAVSAPGDSEFRDTGLCIQVGGAAKVASCGQFAGCSDGWSAVP
jgi:hypothetical protein